MAPPPAKNKLCNYKGHWIPDVNQCRRLCNITRIEENKEKKKKRIQKKKKRGAGQEESQRENQQRKCKRSVTLKASESSPACIDHWRRNFNLEDTVTPTADHDVLQAAVISESQDLE